MGFPIGPWGAHRIPKKARDLPAPGLSVPRAGDSLPHWSCPGYAIAAGGAQARRPAVRTDCAGALCPPLWSRRECWAKKVLRQPLLRATLPLKSSLKSHWGPESGSVRGSLWERQARPSTQTHGSELCSRGKKGGRGSVSVSPGRG